MAVYQVPFLVLTHWIAFFDFITAKLWTVENTWGKTSFSSGLWKGVDVQQTLDQTFAQDTEDFRKWQSNWRRKNHTRERNIQNSVTSYWKYYGGWTGSTFKEITWGLICYCEGEE